MLTKSITYHKLLICGSLVLILIELIGALTFSNHISDVICIILILSIGLLHGSNDLLIQAETVKLSKYSIKLRLTAYILAIGVAVALFYFIEEVMLMLFILYSAFHFGEQHSVHYKLENLPLVQLWKAVFGLSLFFALFSFNYKEVNVILDLFGDLQFSARSVFTMMYLATAIQTVLLIALKSVNAIGIRSILSISF